MMIRLLSVVLLLALPASAEAAAGDPDRGFGRNGTVTLKATDTDAVGFAVKVVSGNRVLAGGAAAGQLVVLKLRASGSLDSSFGTKGQVVPALPGTSLDGVKSIQTFRDGRIVAAGTLRLADNTTRFVALRLLPTGEIDPSFGAGLGYVLAGPADAQLATMVMDRDGNVILGGESGGSPLIVRLLADGTIDPTFGTGGTLAGGTFGLTGRATGLLVRTDGTLTFTVAAGPATFTIVRVGISGAPDPTFGGTGIVNVPLGPGSAPGVGAAALRTGSANTTIVAGTDLTATGRARGAVIRLKPDGTLDTRFGTKGITRISRAGRELRITTMVRDSNNRILLAGTGLPPDSLVIRLRANGARDSRFGNGGLTYPALGQPPGGKPVYTRLDAIDAAGSKAVLVGSSAGPGTLVRSVGGTAYTGRFALTISRLQ